MMTSAEIRSKFLEYFQSKGHVIVPSAPIVIKNDPTLLFTNAGMNQFKEYFLGNKKSPNPRVADTQKCLRVSGKHNDLEEVGVDTYHHTMFEMLGNWSFGDYFKKEAIAWSWELLTGVYGLDKDRLYVTVFEGDASEGLPTDEEAMAEWKKWIGEERILLGNKKDNFWEMGDSGPCGPCTEIHVDCRPDEERRQTDGKTLVNNDHPQVIEIWNNVFIQFNRLRDGSLEPLPAKHVDTGMGFERLVRVLQGKQSNYDTDVFSGTIALIGELTGKTYGYSDSRQDIAFRVLADHIRAIAFAIADGQLPSNTGAGYVIRRILRRAVRYYYSYLDGRHPLLFRLLPLIAGQFQSVFPELSGQLEFVSKVVREEEEAFLRTLGKGIEKFSAYAVVPEAFSPAKASGQQPAGLVKDDFAQQRSNRTVAGAFAFELNDTYGFPIDLTQLMAREAGWEVDMEGYRMALDQQKNRSRAAGQVDTEDWVVLQESTPGGFVGYETLETKSHVIRYRKVKAKGREAYQLVLDTTPFYAESGGQVGDRGILAFGSEVINVTDTKKENDLIIHFTEKLPAHPEGDLVARVDPVTRKNTAVHHSATHLLHAALRRVLGNHVAQKGSLVNGERLRFDFSHFARVTEEEIRQIEQMVNEKIFENIPVVIREMPREQALQSGAMALFGEKYGDLVRVVQIDPAYSVELCGGTHVGATGELGLFRILHESAVAAGVRRVEAISGKAALEYIQHESAELRGIREILKHPKETLKAVEQLAGENGELKKHIERLEARQLVVIRNELLGKDEIIAQINFIGAIVEVSSAEALKKLCFDLKNHLRDFVVVLCANIGGKPFVALIVADNVAAARSIDAGKIVREHIASLIQGGGGGQKNMATAGGQYAGNLQQVIDTVRELVRASS